jgi:Class II Aldolase and Adducin N-terminal domain
MAVVHSHSPAVIPYGITQVPMKPTFHMAAFLYDEPPVFEIRDVAGWTNMLITDNRLGAALADALGQNPVALMRGHGNVVVGPSVPIAVFRAIYTEVNARLQTTAIMLGGPVNYLSAEEGADARWIDQLPGAGRGRHHHQQGTRRRRPRLEPVAHKSAGQVVGQPRTIMGGRSPAMREKSLTTLVQSELRLYRSINFWWQSRWRVLGLARRAPSHCETPWSSTTSSSASKAASSGQYFGALASRSASFCGGPSMSAKRPGTNGMVRRMDPCA